MSELILTGVHCPLCGEVFEHARAEALHWATTHSSARAEIIFRGKKEPIAFYWCHVNTAFHGAGVCFCGENLNSYQELADHLEEAGGMAAHLKNIGSQFLLDRVAGKGYDAGEREEKTVGGLPPGSFFVAES